MTSPAYLGETHPPLGETPYRDFESWNWAMELISRYGGIDGDHHKQWVLDQTARILCGTPVTAKRAAWDDGRVEWRIETGEPSAKYLAWGADCKNEKRSVLGANASAEDLALEFMAIHGQIAPDVTGKEPKEVQHTLCMTLHAVDQHKAWLLDQVARILLGTPVTSTKTIKIGKPTTKYRAWVEEQKGRRRRGWRTRVRLQRGRVAPRVSTQTGRCLRRRSRAVSAHDDYFDVKDAYEKWEKAYERWGKAADSDDRDEDVPAERRLPAEKKAKRAAARYLEACDDLARMVIKTRSNIMNRGWEPTKKRAGK